MKTEYIRTTHRFDNLTREWIYRGDIGEDKFEEWNTTEVNVTTTFRLKEKCPFYSFGAHALRRDRWMDIELIIDQTINMYRGDAAGNTREFKKWTESTPNHRDIIKKDVLEELEYLVSIGMVMKKEYTL